MVIRNAEIPLGSHINAVDRVQIDQGSSWGAGLYGRHDAKGRQELVTWRGVIVGVYPYSPDNWLEVYIKALKHFSTLANQEGGW